MARKRRSGVTTSTKGSKARGQSNTPHVSDRRVVTIRAKESIRKENDRMLRVVKNAHVSTEYNVRYTTFEVYNALHHKIICGMDGSHVVYKGDHPEKLNGNTGTKRVKKGKSTSKKTTTSRKSSTRKGLASKTQVLEALELADTSLLVEALRVVTGRLDDLRN